MAAPRNTTGGLPEFVTSVTLGAMISAELSDHADQVERDAEASGSPRVHAARVQMIRRAAAQTAESAESTG